MPLVHRQLVHILAREADKWEKLLAQCDKVANFDTISDHGQYLGDFNEVVGFPKEFRRFCYYFSSGIVCVKEL